jgi:thioredoxin-like negative regulator of GroEL
MTEPESAASWQVVCLCAAWCGVCREWDAIFRELAATHPEARFAWVDIEDEDEAMGEVEVETFPTVLVAHAGRVLFLGPVQPSAAQLSRLVARLQAQAHPTPSATPAAQRLYERLQGGALSRGAM